MFFSRVPVPGYEATKRWGKFQISSNMARVVDFKFFKEKLLETERYALQNRFHPTVLLEVVILILNGYDQLGNPKTYRLANVSPVYHRPMTQSGL